MSYTYTIERGPVTVCGLQKQAAVAFHCLSTEQKGPTYLVNHKDVDWLILRMRVVSPVTRRQTSNVTSNPGTVQSTHGSRRSAAGHSTSRRQQASHAVRQPANSVPSHVSLSCMVAVCYSNVICL